MNWLLICMQFAITTCTPSARKGRYPTAATPRATPLGGRWMTYARPTTGGKAICPPVPNASSAANPAGVANAWPDGNANGVV